jgi:hypothetical protein
MPSAVTARLRPGISATDATDWRSQILAHELTDPPPIADIEVTISGRWSRAGLVDAVYELSELLVRAGHVSEGPGAREPKQRKAA